MKIIKSGNTYRNFGDDLEVFDKIPNGTYNVCFSKQAGCFLEKRPDMKIMEKVYGNHNEKAEKVLKSFQHSIKNSGVILSGNKGIGKSLFTRILGSKMISNNYPVLIVENNLPNLSSFIDEIDQEVMVLFDEFEKKFKDNQEDMDGANSQEELLSLFDGTSTGKKLFVITCNNFYDLNTFFRDRPGRLKYHFRFENPKGEEIREYLNDNINSEYSDELEEIIEFSKKVELNFDCLNAICSEINIGYSFKETINDLNITIDSGDRDYNLEVFTKTDKFMNKSVELNLFKSKTVRFNIYQDNSHHSVGYVNFDTDNLVMNGEILSMPNVRLTYFKEDKDGDYKVENVSIKLTPCITKNEMKFAL